MKRALFWLLWLLFIAGCSPAAAPAVPPAATPTHAAASPTPPPLRASPSPTARQPAIWLTPDLPAALLESLRLPPGLRSAANPADAALRIEQGSARPISIWTYALAAPFATIADETSTAALKDLWLHGTAIAAECQRLVVDPPTSAVFTAEWGPPSSAVEALPSEQLLERAWQEKTTWAILPFEQLEPRWKVIRLDGQSPIRTDFEPRGYALQITFSLNGDPDLAESVLAGAAPEGLLAPLNRRSERMTTVILTGTTSLVRATAALMEQHGMDYPAQDIGSILRGADILHISNEVAFARNCPAPLPHSGLLFCSQERYIQLLETIDTTVIDLSGDHLNDYGPDALRFTLELYRQRGWQTYGGGASIAEGRKPALFEHNGNKIALIGCNYKAIGYASATQTGPGAVHCDPAWLTPAIQQLKTAGYLPIVTLQDDEYMEAIARSKLQQDFRAAVDAGAVIVSGSQAHQPQALEFYDGALLHYGLGNLFFDQIHSWETTDQAFIDRHVIYAGRHISTELLTTRFIDFARPRLMTPSERQILLDMIYRASGWIN